MTDKVFKWLNDNFYNLFVVLLFFLNVVPIAAPFLLHYDITIPSKAIYFVYSFFCHQQHWKSLHIFDHQYAWCTRDMFIWGSMFIMAVLGKKEKFPPLSLRWLVIYSLPIALDGGIQTIAAIIGYESGNPFYVSNNFFRMVTGSIFGMALGLYIFPRLKEVLLAEKEGVVGESRPPNRAGNMPRGIMLLLMGFMALVYVLLIGIWDVTSTSFRPFNWLDSRTHIPSVKEEWFMRRQTGI